MRNNEKEFERAFEAHSDELFRHALLRLSERERAVDLVQETFTKVWQYVTRGGDIHDYRAFLFRTLRNLIIDEYRRRKTVSLENMLIEGGESSETLLPVDETNTLHAAIERFEGKRVLAMVQELPDAYCEVILLRFVEGLSPQEISAIIGESENVVSVRIHRGLKKLKILLEPQTK